MYYYLNFNPNYRGMLYIVKEPFFLFWNLSLSFFARTFPFFYEKKRKGSLFFCIFQGKVLCFFIFFEERFFVFLYFSRKGSLFFYIFQGKVLCFFIFFEERFLCFLKFLRKGSSIRGKKKERFL